MDFFDKLGKKASKTYKEASEKTNKLAKEAKLKLAMSDNKAKIEEIYEEIGKNVYENHVREEKIELSKLVEKDCTRIDVIADEIEAQRKEMLALKDKKQCENCYTEMDEEFVYCPKCGAKQDGTSEKKEEVQEVEVIEGQETIAAILKETEEKKDKKKSK